MVVGRSLVNMAGGVAAQVFWLYPVLTAFLRAGAFSCSKITMPCFLNNSGHFSINERFKFKQMQGSFVVGSN